VNFIASAAAGTARAARTRTDRYCDDLQFRDANAPKIGTGEQVAPIETARRTFYQLLPQGRGIMIVQQFKGLAGLQGIEASKISAWRFRGAITRTSIWVVTAENMQDPFRGDEMVE